MNLNITITNIIKDFGITANLLGYNYLRTAIKLCIDNPNLMQNTVELYTAVAKEYDTTVSKTERAIRHAIELAWNRADDIIKRNFFGNSIKYKPSNSEFIATIADHVAILFNHYLQSTKMQPVSMPVQKED